MNCSFSLRDEAAADFINGYAWYEEQREGLGELFEISVYKKLKRVCQNPLHYKVSYKNYREALVDKFPFLLVYTVNKELNHILVFAIFHTSRNPRNKLKNRILKKK